MSSKSVHNCKSEHSRSRNLTFLTLHILYLNLNLYSKSSFFQSQPHCNECSTGFDSSLLSPPSQFVLEMCYGQQILNRQKFGALPSCWTKKLVSILGSFYAGSTKSLWRFNICLRSRYSERCNRSTNQKIIDRCGGGWSVEPWQK